METEGAEADRKAAAARLQEKRIEDKEDERVLAKLYKQTAKDLKDQLENLPVEEKARVLEKRLCEKFYEFNKLERTSSKLQLQYDSLQTNMDAINADLNKARAIKGKLEALCKQLQKEHSTVSAKCCICCLPGDLRQQVMGRVMG